MRCVIYQKPSSSARTVLTADEKRLIVTTTMWLKYCILVVFGVSLARCVEIVPLKEVVSATVGSRLEFNCTSPNSVIWEADPASAMPQDAVKERTIGLINLSTMVLDNVTTSNTGVFKCKDVTPAAEAASFRLNVFSVTTQSETFEPGMDAQLGCSVNDDTRTFTYTWKKGDQAVADISKPSGQEYTENENGTLDIVAPPVRVVAGVYTCIAEYEQDGAKSTVEIDVPYYAKPNVVQFEKSKNLVQGEKLVVECEVWGYPKPYITWFKEGEEITVEEGSRYKLKPANTYNAMPVDNARLQIDSVDYDDAGLYMCMARNSMWPASNASQEIEVRVRDKLAALWPFLGIVAEVVILCTIIFIYEKKRNKDAAMEDDADQDGAVPEKKTENVRHRGNSSNPRA